MDRTLPDPDVIAAEIVDGLRSARELFEEVASDLNGAGAEARKA